MVRSSAKTLFGHGATTYIVLLTTSGGASKPSVVLGSSYRPIISSTVSFGTDIPVEAADALRDDLKAGRVAPAYIDLLPPAERKKRTAAIVKKLRWKGPVYGISALTADGTKRLVQDVMSYLEGQREEPDEAARPSRHGA